MMMTHPTAVIKAFKSGRESKLSKNPNRTKPSPKVNSPTMHARDADQLITASTSGFGFPISILKMYAILVPAKMDITDSGPNESC